MGAPKTTRRTAMRSHYLAWIAAPIFAASACTQSGPNVTTTGGGGTGGEQTGAGGGGGGTGEGGSTAQGGANGSGGAPGPGGSGGSATDGGGQGGATGTGGGSGGLIDTVTGVPNTFGESLKNSWMLFPCYMAPNSQDCQTNPVGTACPNMNTSLPFEQQGIN